MANDSIHLPGILAEIAEAAGPIAAVRLAQAKGGARVYIPREGRLADDHWLIQALGMDAARAIVARYGGDTLEIPHSPLTSSRSRIWRTIRDGLAQGLSEAEIARLAGVAGRTIRRHKAGDSGKAQTDQHRLF